MTTTRQRRPAGRNWALERLLRQLRDSEIALGQTCDAWLARRELTVQYEWNDWPRVVRTDGVSVWAPWACVLTRPQGLVMAPDRRPALLSGRRFKAGGPERNAVVCLERALQARGVPHLQVWPPFGSAWPADPDVLHYAWRLHERLRGLETNEARRNALAV